MAGSVAAGMRKVDNAAKAKTIKTPAIVRLWARVMLKCVNLVRKNTFCRDYYRPNVTSSTLMSAGDTPGMREACPMVCGRMRVSF